MDVVAVGADDPDDPSEDTIKRLERLLERCEERSKRRREKGVTWLEQNATHFDRLRFLQEQMREAGKQADESLKRLQDVVEKEIHQRQTARRIAVNKKTHRVRFEGETEGEVIIVIEKRVSDE